jgi:hypothetical protein
MTASELFHADGKPTGVFYCGKCRIVHRDRIMADNCCVPYRCKYCDVEVDKYRLVCAACCRKQDIAKEAARFEKAEKLTAWDGPVVMPDSDRYFSDVGDYLDQTEWDEEQTECEYLWTCHAKPVCHLDYDTIIENATQEPYEDFDPESLRGRKDLEVALAVFNELNKGNVCWTPDYKVALLLPKTKIEEPNG